MQYKPIHAHDAERSARGHQAESSVSSSGLVELFEQGLRGTHVSTVEFFAEPVVDGYKQIAGFLAFVSTLPQSCEVRLRPSLGAT